MYATPCLVWSCSISNQAKYKINSDFPCNNPKIIWYLLLSIFYIDYQISCAYYHSNDLNCIWYAMQFKIPIEIHFMDIELIEKTSIYLHYLFNNYNIINLSIFVNMNLKYNDKWQITNPETNNVYEFEIIVIVSCNTNNFFWIMLPYNFVWLWLFIIW